MVCIQWRWGTAKDSPNIYPLLCLLQLALEALVGETYASDIGLDNITVWTGTCANGPQIASTSAPGEFLTALHVPSCLWILDYSVTGTPGPSSTTKAPSGYPLLWKCNFDGDFNDTCKVVQLPGTWPWIRFNGPTPSSMTGPDAGYSGNLEDYYFYLEASGQTLTPGTSSQWASPPLSLPQGPDPFTFPYLAHAGFRVHPWYPVDSCFAWKLSSITTCMGNTWALWMSQQLERAFPIDSSAGEETRATSGTRHHMRWMCLLYRSGWVPLAWNACLRYPEHSNAIDVCHYYRLFSMAPVGQVTQETLQ